jgi:excinuclease ABC subunit A
LNAIIGKFTDGDKLEPPDDSLLSKVKKKILGKSKGPGEELLKTKFADLPAEIRNAFFHGTKRRLTFRQGTYRYESDWKGALRTMRDRMENPPSEKTKLALVELIAPVPCPICEGARLQPESLAVKVNGLGIAEYSMLPIDESVKKIDEIKLNAREETIAGLVLKEIRDRLKFLAAVGIGFRTLDRASATLWGGEGQRIRLATQIGSQPEDQRILFSKAHHSGL